ncbi:MAG TPA: hypothetical protein VIT92_09185 [Burkholderiaceae bacterium]
MHLKLTWKYLLAWYALSEVLSELHEQAHITTGYLLAGCYGPRNFNVWQLCAENPPLPAFLPSLAGPLFSYLVFWLGAWLMTRPHTAGSRRRIIGFSLTLAALPFARIFTSAMGGGDEKTVLMLMGLDPLLARWSAFAVVLVMCGVPIIVAARTLNNRRRALIVAGFCILPLPVIMLWKFKFLNSLLGTGHGAQNAAFGAPAFVLGYVALCAVGLLLMRRWLLAGDPQAQHSSSPLPVIQGA